VFVLGLRSAGDGYPVGTAPHHQFLCGGAEPALFILGEIQHDEHSGNHRRLPEEIVVPSEKGESPMGAMLPEPDSGLQLHIEAGPHLPARPYLDVHAVSVEVRFREGVACGGSYCLDVGP